jgi:hypothetical protein
MYVSASSPQASAHPDSGINPKPGCSVPHSSRTPFFVLCLYSLPDIHRHHDPFILLLSPLFPCVFSLRLLIKGLLCTTFAMPHIMITESFNLTIALPRKPHEFTTYEIKGVAVLLISKHNLQLSYIHRSWLLECTELLPHLPTH